MVLLIYMVIFCCCQTLNVSDERINTMTSCWPWSCWFEWHFT